MNLTFSFGGHFSVGDYILQNGCHMLLLNLDFDFRATTDVVTCSESHQICFIAVRKFLDQRNGFVSGLC